MAIGILWRWVIREAERRAATNTYCSSASVLTSTAVAARQSLDGDDEIVSLEAPKKKAEFCQGAAREKIPPKSAALSFCQDKSPWQESVGINMLQ